ncbi:MAG: ABC transporter substrate-binding protein [Candidatus Nanopelagicales bacterium]
MNKTVLAPLAALVVALSGCTNSVDEAPNALRAGSVSPVECTIDKLQTVDRGSLTVATGQPAYEPWVLNDAPEKGEGFEAAVAFAAAAKLGYADEDIAWVRTTFDGAIAPGAKDFDWNLQQYTITEKRREAVDFSAPYYTVKQAVLATSKSRAANAASVADLKTVKLGAAVGSTSLDDAERIIAPQGKVSVFNDNAAAVTALNNGQIDALVVDLPTAFYLVAAELDDGKIVGQLGSTSSGEPDEFGILLAKDSPLTLCTSWAIDQLREDGTLDVLTQKWLGGDAGAPTLD